VVTAQRGTTRRRRGGVIGTIVVGLALAMLVTATTASAGEDQKRRGDDNERRNEERDKRERNRRPAIVFNGEGNNLNAYETTPPFKKQTVIRNHNADPNGLDINAQICFLPDGSRRFIAGEDTGQPNPPQGWGIFKLRGHEVGDLSAREVAKLTPTYQGSSDNAENYGCGVLSDGRVVTGDVGNQALGPGDGQLIVWFPPFKLGPNRYCKVAIDIATAGSIWIDKQDRVYITSARPPTWGVWRYTDIPTSDNAAGGCGRKDSTGAPLATAVHRELFIPNTHSFTPYGLAPSNHKTLYVSSVFTGNIAEYDLNGTFLRDILKPPPGETLGAQPYSTGTPLGIGVGPDGTLYYADIGLVVSGGGVGPGRATGTVRRIRFVNDMPQTPEKLDSGLAFPDGIGILAPGAARHRDHEDDD
jgi:hypothetical protein